MLMETLVFNERMKSGYPNVIVNRKKLDVPHLANYLVEKLLPDMVSNNECCFFWHFSLEDISCLKEELYTKERDRFIKDKFNCEDCDALWQVYFELSDGTKMKAEIKNEVWFEKNKKHDTSPFAFVFDAPLASGYMYSKVSFSKA